MNEVIKIAPLLIIVYSEIYNAIEYIKYVQQEKNKRERVKKSLTSIKHVQEWNFAYLLSNSLFRKKVESEVYVTFIKLSSSQTLSELALSELQIYCQLAVRESKTFFEQLQA